jgi:hypothetical protein
MGSDKSVHLVGSLGRDADLGSIPDVLLPTQFFESVGGRSFSSEQRLMLAVLADAINVLQRYRGSPSLRKRKSLNEASSWIFDCGIKSPFSFDHVCDGLEIDAKNLRSRLTQLISDPAGGTLVRVRLKEASRIQRVTANRVRRPRRARGRRCGAPVGKNTDGAVTNGIATCAEESLSPDASEGNKT